MKKKLLCVVLAAAGMCYAETTTRTPIKWKDLNNPQAIAGATGNNVPSAYKDRPAQKAFDGTGMSADGLTHSGGTEGKDDNFMLSSNKSGEFPWYIQIDLGEVKCLDAVKFFNFNFDNGGGTLNRGVKNYKLYVSTDNSWQTSATGIQNVYTEILSGTLKIATGGNDYAGEYFTFTPVLARYVALVAFDDFDDSTKNLNYNGIAEIQLFESDEEPPVVEPPEEPEEPEALPEFSICCVGDSITEGADSATASNKHTYRTYLAELLNAAGMDSVVWKGSKTSPHSGNDLANEGWCGKNAAEIASIYEDKAAGDKADVLMLHAGHNYDVTKATEVAIIAAVTNAHARIISAARTHNPNVTVLYAKVITSGKLPKYSYIPALNSAIEDLAEELTTAASPVVVVDMASGWDYAQHCLSDLVHPNETGARLMADRWLAALLTSPFMAGTEAFVEAEAFDNKGGWVVDPQFTDVMGSPYLLAHGKGVPVADATTSVTFGFPGLVRAWVRTRDWTPHNKAYEGEKPGRFRLAVAEATFPAELGVAPAKWGWVDAGVVRVGAGGQTLALKDLTGFEGRCDAVYLTPVATTNAPPSEAAALAAWRAERRGEAGDPTDVVEADFVVVGGGIAGTCAAVAAADANPDLNVVIVQDRPMLGGNASDEIRVRTERQGMEFHWIVKAVKNTKENGNSHAATDDANRAAFVAQYKNLTPHLGWRAYGVVTNAKRRIVAVDARHVETGARRRFVAPLFADCTGDGWLGYWAGAAYRMGREAKSEFGEEKYAQDTADSSTMGNSLLWYSTEGSEAVDFPEVPWAKAISGTASALSGGWQWEAGLGTDENTIYDAEELRDRLFCAIYGRFSNAKQSTDNANRYLDWVPYIAGKRESRRIIGDYIVRESDVTSARKFEDAIGIATWTIDLHFYSGNSGFLSSTTHVEVPNWWMPYRSLCCRDVPNLFMAGRCASYTHVAFGSSRVMHAGGQQGVAVGYAAALCNKYNCEPREIYRDAAKTEALQALINRKEEYAWPVQSFETETVSVIVDNADKTGVEISGAWTASNHNSDRFGENYLHNVRITSEDMWVRFTPDIPSDGAYRVSLFWNGDETRSKTVPVEIVHADGVTTNRVDMTPNPGTWGAVGTFNFKKGAAGSVRILTTDIGTVTKDGKTEVAYVIADAVKFAIVVNPAKPGDLDGNGLPDDWERRHFLQMTGTDPSADPDGDGVSNAEEFRRRSDPMNPHSRIGPGYNIIMR